ncbi:MAG: hypothetical protein NVSMB56_09680 [Pyrinomonadaceae bacterium]
MTIENGTIKIASQRIMSSVAPENFVGRDETMRRLIACKTTGERGVVLLAAPLAGASELLKQIYDHLFAVDEAVAPVYFAWSRADRTITAAASRFLYDFLLQVIAYRRRDAALVNAAPLWSDFVELVAPEDAELFRALIENFIRARESGEERTLLRVCLTAPQKLAANDVRSIVLFDDAHLIETLAGVNKAQTEFAQMFDESESCFVFAGLRRRLLDVLYAATGLTDLGATSVVSLEHLNEEDARRLVENVAREYEVSINDETRDLLVQQCGGYPSLLNMILRAARQQHVALTSFLAFQKLYTDELLGGRINRRFQAMLSTQASAPATRRALIRALYEELVSTRGKSVAESWGRRLNLNTEELTRLLRELNTDELINIALPNAPTIVENGMNAVWRDSIRVNYRLHVAVEPRALVVADMLTEVLKRAPQTMARAYRRQTAFGLRELLTRFDCQLVPNSLLHFDRFNHLSENVETEQLTAAIDSGGELIRLPQLVHVATATSFYPPMKKLCDDERCLVAHGFDGTAYTDANEVTWLAVEIEAKTPIGQAVAEVWLNRLRALAEQCEFENPRWLIVAPEGFTSDAAGLLTGRGACSANRVQLGGLAARLEERAIEKESGAQDEFELIVPMSEDAELIAAQTIEQFARRMNFPAQAISQIKTAIVEACINAAEHSLSPEQKIYVRFRAEHDRLTVTVSSRGLAVSPTARKRRGQHEQTTSSHAPREISARRGWGLQLIRASMDEVEFERVDDGTRLRMTKYLHRESLNH